MSDEEALCDQLRRELEEARGPHCTGCGNAIDPDVCHCGEYAKDHNQGSGHSPVPMGCDCHRDDTDWRKVANTRGMLLWQARQRLLWLEAGLAESVKLQSHYATLLNQHDCGRRTAFPDVAAWLQRLKDLQTAERSVETPVETVGDLKL